MRVTAGMRRLDRCGGLTAASLSSLAAVRSGVLSVRYRPAGEPLKSETVYRYSPDNAFSALDEWTSAERGEWAVVAYFSASEVAYLHLVRDLGIVPRR
jgi:hypothetical protein